MKRIDLKLFCVGIYRIKVVRPDKSPKYYVGQTVRFKSRRQGHFKDLRAGKHLNPYLQYAFNKYGEQAFSFEVLLVCERRKDIMEFYEQLVVNSYGRENVYNICLDCVGSQLGVPVKRSTVEKRLKTRSTRTYPKRILSESTLEALRAANLGSTRSAESIAQRTITRRANGWNANPEVTRAKQSKVMTGKHPTQETKQQISKTKKERGQRPSEEVIEKAASKRRGTTRSEETKRLISIGLTGKKKSADEIARRQATRRANAEKRGYWTPPEACAKLVVSSSKRKGWVTPPETREKQRISALARRERERNCKQAERVQSCCL